MGKNYQGGSLSINADTQFSEPFGLGTDSFKVGLLVLRTAGAGAVDAVLQGGWAGGWADTGSAVTGAAGTPMSGGAVDDVWPLYRIRASSVGQADIEWRVVAIG